jgi:hypothetical protein
MLNPLVSLKFLPDPNMHSNRGYTQTAVPLKEAMVNIKDMFDLCQVVT